MFIVFVGLVTLKKLKIQVDKYYASEIDLDAILVATSRHGADMAMVQLGDIKNLTLNRVGIKALCMYVTCTTDTAFCLLDCQ